MGGVMSLIWGGKTMQVHDKYDDYVKWYLEAVKMCHSILRPLHWPNDPLESGNTVTRKEGKK